MSWRENTEAATGTRRTRFRFDRPLSDVEQFDVQEHIENSLKGIQDVDVSSNFDISLVEMQMRCSGSGDFDMMVFAAELGSRYGTEVEIVRDQVV